ncbi:hypothetical protein D3C80_1993700 [compost metagenome]
MGIAPTPMRSICVTMAAIGIPLPRPYFSWAPRIVAPRICIAILKSLPIEITPPPSAARNEMKKNGFF